MDLRNVPYRSDVLTWEPDDLAEYFRMLKYKDCEKVVRKHSINGQRFLSVSGITQLRVQQLFRGILAGSKDVFY